MKTNPDLLTLSDVCAYFSLSESSIRRRVRSARNGTSNFPLPLFSSGSRVIFRKVDILSWAGEDAESITITSPPLPSFPKVSPFPSAVQTRKTLESFGINLPSPNW